MQPVGREAAVVFSNAPTYDPALRRDVANNTVQAEVVLTFNAAPN